MSGDGKRAQFAVTPEHIGWAVLHLRDLERAPRARGGKAGAEQVRQRLEAKRNIDWLAGEYDRQSVEIPDVPVRVSVEQAARGREDARDAA